VWRIASQAPTDRDRPELFPTGGPTELAAAKKFTAEHDAFWAASRKAHGDAAGTRALVEVLLLHRHLERVDVLAGITAALSVGAANADVVAVEARKVAGQRGSGTPVLPAVSRERVF